MIPLAQQDHGAPNAYREMAVDPARNALVYRTSDNRLAAFDLKTLTPAEPAVAVPIERLGAIAYAQR